MAELMLARATSLRYAGRPNKPARLVQFMFRYGLDYLHLTPLSTEQLESLSVATMRHLCNVFADNASSSSGTSNLEEEVPKLTLPWVAPRDDCVDLPLPENDGRCHSVYFHLDWLLQAFLQHANDSVTTALPQARDNNQPVPSSASSLSQWKHKRPQAAEEEEGAGPELVDRLATFLQTNQPLISNNVLKAHVESLSVG